ncbi:carbohydrate-binding module family 50 protein [Hydnomerulius pinastri MD-312]|uniref:Carbohydrate-binding module family 50 protein n=1 Tax=Hydnomerulius pinastri MD-312 TaxID=994086 RepID=A0A0C9W2G1_9AGAM|nr:carbohydrate-binding module family 50 protein [Hydnomerulius pinastri MD-312]
MYSSTFTKTVSAAAMVGSTLVAATLPANCDRNTTVYLGETCDIISQYFNVSTYQLAAVNAGVIDAGCDNLAVGEPLCLGLTGQDCSTTHVIVSGDTCESISAATGVPYSTIITNNPNVNEICSNIYPGEVLCTASEIYVYLNLTSS